MKIGTRYNFGFSLVLMLLVVVTTLGLQQMMQF